MKHDAIAYTKLNSIGTLQHHLRKPILILLINQTILQTMIEKASDCANWTRRWCTMCVIPKQTVQYSLLGNYTHCTPSSRPIGAVRRFLYHRLQDGLIDQQNQDWFTQMMLECPYAVEFCIRDCIMFHMLDDPSFEQHLGCLFDVQNFYRVIRKTND